MKGNDNFTDNHGNVVSKRERYNWKVTDKPGEFHLMDKTDLKVDSSYQRRHKHQKVMAMAREWSWVSCATICVAIRGDDWYVLDGQHRVLAALLRDDIKKLPCMLFELETRADEAKSFLKLNTDRRPMSMVDRFKALLMSESHEARVVNELVLSSGRHVASGGAGNYFSAVQQAIKCVKEDEPALRRIWPVLTAICEPDKRITQPLLGGMWYLERHMLQDESLGNTHWKRRMVQVGYETLLETIDRAAAFHAGKGMKVSALGIVQAINKGLRNHLKHSIRVEAEDE